jgi:hypothetical protein
MKENHSELDVKRIEWVRNKSRSISSGQGPLTGLKPNVVELRDVPSFEINEK